MSIKDHKNPIEIATESEIKIVMRPVYIINGANRAYLSERAALNKLSSLITERQFMNDGRAINEPDIEVTLENGSKASQRGALTAQFMGFKEGVLFALTEKLKHEKEIVRLQKELAIAVAKSEAINNEVDNAYNKLQESINKKII